MKPTEYSFHRFLNGCVLLQQENLKNFQDYVEGWEVGYHIYMICRRKRVTIVPERFRVNDGIMYMTFKFHDQDIFIEKQLKFQHYEKTDNFTIESSYPYSQFKIYYEGKKYQEAKASLFIQKFFPADIWVLDLEVLYIWQAFWKDGERTAVDRLGSHSTLQKIYSDASVNNPDSEIFILLCNFSESQIMLMNGQWIYSDTDIRESDTLVSNAISSLHGGMNEWQVINITEAALIKYFQPYYNVHFKKIFPSMKHDYHDFYNLDFNSIGIELNTEETLNCKLYSDVTDRTFYHFETYVLDTWDSRQDMFDLSFLKKNKESQ